MSLFLRFGQGDATEWHDRVRAALTAEYQGRDSWGGVEVELHYTSGLGYQIIRAQYFRSAVGTIGPGGDLPKPDPPEDYTAQVRTILASIGAPLAV